MLIIFGKYYINTKYFLTKKPNTLSYTMSTFSSLFWPSSGVVQQQGLARHGVLHERGQQRHPQGLPAVRRQPCGVRHHRHQPPAQPHQGAAVRGHRVSGPGALRALSLHSYCEAVN